MLSSSKSHVLWWGGIEIKHTFSQAVLKSEDQSI